MDPDYLFNLAIKETSALFASTKPDDLGQFLQDKCVGDLHPQASKLRCISQERVKDFTAEIRNLKFGKDFAKEFWMSVEDAQDEINLFIHEGNCFIEFFGAAKAINIGLNVLEAVGSSVLCY